MNRPAPIDFSTNRKMLNKDILRYCENYASYLSHIKNYIGEDFTRGEVAWLTFLKARIESFLKGAPHSEATYKFEARYKRILTQLSKL